MRRIRVRSRAVREDERFYFEVLIGWPSKVLINARKGHLDGHCPSVPDGRSCRPIDAGPHTLIIFSSALVSCRPMETFIRSASRLTHKGSLDVIVLTPSITKRKDPRAFCPNHSLARSLVVSISLMMNLRHHPMKLHVLLSSSPCGIFILWSCRGAPRICSCFACAT